ncbi:MAG: pilus assembly protein PilP [Gammaproteobacteria bacterium]|nr:pilus assembly protein PilP [Gammaproteobacteria bacterium]
MMRNLHALLVISLIVLLSACGGDRLDDLKNYVAETRENLKGQVQPVPDATVYQSYQYSVAKRRDPFKPSVTMVKAATKNTVAKKQPNEGRNKEELEKYNLESLAMVGVLNRKGHVWAIIKAPDSTIHHVRQGNYIGQQHGKITDITDSEILVNETVVDGLGRWVERPNKLSLMQ